MAVRTNFRGGRLRARWASAAALSVALVAGGPALTAAATEPVVLDAGHVFDDADVLTRTEEFAAEARIEQLRTNTGLDLWVVYVDEFTDPSDAENWANDTARNNGLNPQQYLLAVAVDTRQLYLSADSAGPLTPEQATAIENERIIPALSNDDWAGAVDATAAGLENADDGGTGGLDPDGPSGLTVALWVVVGVVVIAVIAVFVVRSRRKRDTGQTAAPAGPPPVPTEELARQAASALVDTDDAIRASEQELGFATAQFGDAATTEFAAALQSARDKLAQAFTLQQQLDDDVPDDEEQVRAWNTQIAQLCAEANHDLDEKAEAFDELRKLEAEAPAALARVRDARTAAASAIDASAEKLTTLRRSYAPEALATVDDNVEQARARIAFADAQLAAAESALDDRDTGEAAVGIRAAEEAVGQAVVLEDAIDTLATDLVAGEQQAVAIVEGIEQDVRTAMTLPDPDGRVAAVIDVTRGDLDTARADLAGSQRRPLHTIKALQATDQRVDEVVQSVRDAAVRSQRVTQQLGFEMSRAQRQVSATESFITARRGAVGSEARTRLAEAGAALTRAQQTQTSEPDQALVEAQRANTLAGQALESARDDVGGFSSGGSIYADDDGDSSFMGALLGGIIGDSLFSGGGGRSSGGFGGGFGGFSGGSSRGSGRSSFGGGSRRSSSFGGGGTRSRRGGGRF
ncbi:TPM domain-containing protein [Microbacterium sp. P06]|uniref:TPM domain-containing protein n=1 Tax=Microbacterium sp. P06 TaxID=3366949 RepID=UPI0037469CBB